MTGGDWQTWEGIARDILEQTGFGDGEPVDAFELATVCGLRIVAKQGPQRLDGDTIHLDVRARAERQQGAVVHELGHWALRFGGEQDTERGASYVGGALLVPRADIVRQTRGVWRLDDLRRAHPNASHELLARRISEVRDAVVTIVDHCKVKRRIASPWLPTPGRLSELERALVDAAYRTEQPARLGTTQAIPVFDGHWRRVVLIST